MRRDLLLLGEMIDAIEQIQRLVADVADDELALPRERRDSLLWNYTVLGEAAVQVSDEVKTRFPAVPWQRPARLRNRSSTVTGRSTSKSLSRQLPTLVVQLREVVASISNEANTPDP